jgi:protein gp37
MENSGISWTTNTFNGWFCCTKLSPACTYCYAEALSLKYGYVPGWGPGHPRKPTSEANWRKPLRWNAEAERSGKRVRVFNGSLSDVCDAEAPDHLRRRLFELIKQTPYLDWLLLTKRPELIRLHLERIGFWDQMPMPNVWVGTTTESQQRFDERWAILKDIPAKVRFVSAEPLLGEIVLPDDIQGKLHWLIAGGETTRKRDLARPMKPEWARSLRDQCAAKGIGFHFKQHGNRIPRPDGSQPWVDKRSQYYLDHHDLLDGVRHHAFPVTA